MANYASDSDSDGDAPAATEGGAAPGLPESSALLPPPPLDLLQPPNFITRQWSRGVASGASPMWKGTMLCMSASLISHAVVIPSEARKHVAHVMKRAASFVPDLYTVDADYALSELCKDEQKLDRVLLSREFHVSLGRTVAIQVHQIESLVAMLRQKFRSQQRYWMDFNKWEHFINDDCTRSFLSLEVTSTGLPEISKQITMVDDVYRLHGLPEFYKNPRPHISLAWALGDVSYKLKQAIKEIEKTLSSMGKSQQCNLRCKFSHIVCKIGKKMYDICKLAD
uniref:U6 snRNA phosphodiesterase 1 n=1 Tax=Leersia perrieri TaxID=77586 RepID=A0A0D9VIY8_9ORYZ